MTEHEIALAWLRAWLREFERRSREAMDGTHTGDAHGLAVWTHLVTLLAGMEWHDAPFRTTPRPNGLDASLKWLGSSIELLEIARPSNGFLFPSDALMLRSMKTVFSTWAATP